MHLESLTLALAFATFTPANALLYANRRSFLLIHGKGTSAGAFANSPTAAGAKDFIAGVPRRPDQGTGFVPLNWQYVAVDAGTEDGSWWQGSDLRGMEASVATVEAAIEEGEGSITGLVGHGQGGLVAAVVAARAALGLGPVGTASSKSLDPTALKFAVICGAAMPEAGTYADLLRQMRDSRDAGIRTLHCLSEDDPTSQLGKELAACFPNAETLWHGRGAAMPDRSWWKETKAFPDRATGVYRYVDQYTVASSDTPTDFATPTNAYTPTTLPTPTPTVT